MFKSIFIPALLACAVLGWAYGPVFAQKPLENRRLEILPPEGEPSYRLSNMRVSRESGYPLAWYRIDATVKGAPSRAIEATAAYFLETRSELLGLKKSVKDLRHTATRETPGGYHVRFRQHHAGFPVYQGEVVVNFDRQRRVTLVLNGSKPTLTLADATLRVSLPQARERARNYLQIRKKIRHSEAETVVYYHQKQSRLAHRIVLVPAEERLGDWEVLVDAHSGEVLRVEDQRCYRPPSSPETVPGRGWVFAPDPLTRARTSYQPNGPFGDNDDADSDSLTAQLVERTLEVVRENGSYLLKGPYAKIADFEAPFEGDFRQSSADFLFTRGEDAFEAVNTYFHLDQSLRYINETLGFAARPYQYLGGIKADPHGWNGADQSSYSSITGELSFGEGGVDDAEDPDVILHELGHALHDWLSNGELSQVDGLSEGCGDYWAKSYNRSLGMWDPVDPPYHWVFQWDGHNEFFSGRVTNYEAVYPDDLTGQIHTDGQIWASALMEIWEIIGRTATDRNFLEMLAMLHRQSNQEDAAQAFLQADINLHGGAHVGVIQQIFLDRGYSISVPAPQIAHIPLGDTENIDGPYPVSAEVTAAFRLEKVLLVYEAGEMVSDTLEMIPEGDIYQAEIPGSGIPSEYHYYLMAIDQNGFAAANPIGAPAAWHTFFAGPDLLPPRINHPPITAAGFIHLPLDVTAEVQDELGIDTVIVEYRLNEVEQAPFGLTAGADHQYRGTFRFDSSDVRLGDWVEYRLRARDRAAIPNETLLPSEGFFRFQINQVVSATRTVAIDIPDGLASGIADTLWVAGSGNTRIADVNVIFRASHTWLGDLIVRLTAPDGREITLIDRPGIPGSDFGSPANHPNLLLDDAAAENIETVSAGDRESVSGVFRPSPDGLSALNGLDPQGEWRIHVSDNAVEDIGQLQEWGLEFTLQQLTAVETLPATLPARFELHQNYPNPFNPSTTIHFELPESRPVSLTVYNLLGQKMRALVEQRLSAGSYQVRWEGRDQAGRLVASGVYLYRLEAGSFTRTRKMILLR